jgi:hypothetical protein
VSFTDGYRVTIGNKGANSFSDENQLTAGE